MAINPEIDPDANPDSIDPDITDSAPEVNDPDVINPAPDLTDPAVAK